jgi:hypothetical protein
MHFEPAPSNDFADFIAEYHGRCQARVPLIRAVAGKWSFEDLIPGLSDFDTRFIVDDAMTARDWAAMSLEVGHVHTELARQRPHWARNLEHLPGVNLTVSEVTHPLLYYPEFSQWTLYGGEPAAVSRVSTTLASAGWSPRAELYHLKRVATFFGSYQRGIDPPVNLGPWESKYPLHSRYMHYFAPPVQAMVSLALRRTVRGKLEALRLAWRVLPNSGVLEQLFDVLSRHYECPSLYVEPGLSELERQLERYLSEAWATLADKVTLIAVDGHDTRQAIARKLEAVPIDPFELFFAVAKFGRLMKGRLLFYASEVAWFQTDFLIANELGRIVSNFYSKPLLAYGLSRYGERLDAAVVLDRLRGNLLTEAQAQGMLRFAQVASEPLVAGQYKQQARKVADCYDPVLESLEAMAGDMLARASAGSAVP